ncbi:TetR/AcrR family transcriptional regulator [Streptomyces tanashiensis]
MRALVRRFAAEAAADGERLNGCFVTNSAAELGPHDTVVARRVELSWEQVETLLHGALARARAGTPADRDPRALARMLLVLLQGIRVVGKVSSEPGRVADAAEQALGLLD